MPIGENGVGSFGLRSFAHQDCAGHCRRARFRNRRDTQCSRTKRRRKFSRKIRLEGGAVDAQQVCEFKVDGLLGPLDEAAPSILQLPPDELDLVEFGTVGRQVKQERFVIEQSSVRDGARARLSRLPLSTETLTKIFARISHCLPAPVLKELKDRTGKKSVTPHDLRRYFVRTGCSERIVIRTEQRRLRRAATRATRHTVRESRG